MILTNLIKKFNNVINKPVCNKTDFNYSVYRYLDSGIKIITVRLTFTKESGFNFCVFDDYNDHTENNVEYQDFKDAFKDFVERCDKYNSKLY